jgi:hypothetical protein
MKAPARFRLLLGGGAVAVVCLMVLLRGSGQWSEDQLQLVQLPESQVSLDPVTPAKWQLAQGSAVVIQVSGRSPGMSSALSSAQGQRCAQQAGAGLDALAGAGLDLRGRQTAARKAQAAAACRQEFTSMSWLYQTPGADPGALQYAKAP